MENLTPLDLSVNWCALALCILTNTAPEDAFLYLDGVRKTYRSSRTRLNEEDDRKMAELKDQGYTYREIADLYQLSLTATIKRIKRYNKHKKNTN